MLRGAAICPIVRVLASDGVGAQRITNDTISQLHLGVGDLAVGGTDDEARSHALDEGLEHLASELGGSDPPPARWGTGRRRGGTCCE